MGRRGGHSDLGHSIGLSRKSGGGDADGRDALRHTVCDGGGGVWRGTAGAQCNGRLSAAGGGGAAAGERG